MAKQRRKTTRVLPSARRLTGSLRDLGYDTSEAVADLIDNSIAARAKRVDITIHFDGADSWIRIADDGRGMDAATITEAMRYGAHRSYEDDDLGKFGLGLKTASLSQCRRVTVASRTSKTAARAEVRQLDLDYVEEHDEWDVLILGKPDRPAAAVEPLKQHAGTVILWEGLDRILNYKNPGSGWARNKLMGLAESLDDHLGMVFHRFLAGEVSGRKLVISLNGTRVDAWDPFARDEEKTESLKTHDIEVNTANGHGLVRLEPFVLPPKANFSTEAAHRRLSGPNNWNRQQGFYVYRANRLIQSGGWSYIRTQDEHTKLARVALLFTPDLDAAFGINVAKMRVLLPMELKERIEPIVKQTVARAQAVYRAKPDKPKSGGSPSGGVGPGGERTGTGAGGSETEPPGSNGAGSRAAGGGGGVGNPTLAEARREALEAAAAEADEAAALSRIVSTLRTQAPQVARDLGW